MEFSLCRVGFRVGGGILRNTGLLFAPKGYVSGSVVRLKEVPFVAVEILEDGDRAVRFMAWRLEEFDVVGEHSRVVAPEVVGMEEEEDAAAALMADRTSLLGCGGFGEQEAGATGVGRRDEEPALVIAEGRIFDDAES